jgi:protein-tyrosine sulfotransferase
MPTLPPPSGAGPVFILSSERSGSTLLRFILDTHPALFCPDEIQLGELCTRFAAAAEGVAPDERAGGEGAVEPFSPAVLERTRRALADLMEEAARRRGKRIWCEKSPGNLAHTGVIRRVFPGARFLCLYRHGLDFVSSCLEACRHGFWPGLAPYVIASPHNLIDAMAQAWLDKTRDLLAFEHGAAGRCLRLRYEDLVIAPEKTLRSLCSFLAIEHAPEILTQVFSASHLQRPGHGDPVALFATTIYKSRLGLGNKLPWRDRLSRRRIEELNEVLELLGYPGLQPGEPLYSLGVEPAPRAAPPALPSVRDVFERLLPERIAAHPELTRGLGSSYRIAVTGNGGGEWVLDFSAPSGPLVRTHGDAPCVITIDSASFLDVINGRVGAMSLFSEGALQVAGEPETSALQRLVHLLASF